MCLFMQVENSPGMMDALMDIMQSEQESSIRLASTLPLYWLFLPANKCLSEIEVLISLQLPFISRTA